MVLEGVRLEIGASVGVALCPADGVEAEELLRAADLAMYRAKGGGSNTFRFFETSMDAEVRERAALEDDFRAALSAGDVRPHYQPLIEMEDGQICGFELLARWHHPDRAPVRPDVFVPLAEQMGLMGELTATMLRVACRDARAWERHIKLAVNISPAQFQDPAMPTQILSTLLAEDFPPSRLEVEVTESALVGDIAAAKHTLAALQAVGIKVALDDFGTGYSSLYHLREMKFDKLKIDRSFVQSMRGNPESRKIVEAVLGLAKSLDMPAVAEGIEDLETLRALAQRGCTYGQGYLFSRAVPVDEVDRLLSQARPGGHEDPSIGPVRSATSA